MPLARFRTDDARQSFVAALLGRGYRLAPPPVPGILRGLGIGQYRVYDYQRKHWRPELRVSYWQPPQGPRSPVPRALPADQHRERGNCITTGHEAIPEKARGLCPSCHRRWLYWSNAIYRKKRRLDSRAYKRAKARAAEKFDAMLETA